MITTSCVSPAYEPAVNVNPARYSGAARTAAFVGSLTYRRHVPPTGANGKPEFTPLRLLSTWYVVTSFIVLSLRKVVPIPHPHRVHSINNKLNEAFIASSFAN